MEDPRRSPRPHAARGHRTPLLAALGALALLLVAGPAMAYIIYLKDGSKLVAREKYEVVDATAYIVLTSGTRTSIDAGEIDVERTEKANLHQLGTALVLEDGQVREMTTDEIKGPKRRKTLADLIASRQAATRELPTARRQEATPGDQSLARTAAGFLDLASMPPRPFPDLTLTGELRQLFSAQGLDEVEVTEGTAGDRPLLRVVTATEAAAFRAVAVSCAGLLRLEEGHPGEVSAIELVLTTPNRERAGQFVIEPEMARELLAKQVDIATFYLAHVQF